MFDNNSFGLAHLWAQGDAVTHGVAVALLAMSVASWYVSLHKAWTWLRNRATAAAIDAFWSAETPAEGVEMLARRSPDSPALLLAVHADAAARHHERQAQRGMSSNLDRADFLTRSLRQAIARSQAQLERGLTLLASVGATAPFVGLLGTVWGIFHALVRIGEAGQATLDTVAGPVGEALIMTAAGLAVALPAVFAYNAFVRSNRLLLAELDGFAHDLHAWFTTGGRVALPAVERGTRPLRAVDPQPAGAR